MEVVLSAKSQPPADVSSPSNPIGDSSALPNPTPVTTDKDGNLGAVVTTPKDEKNDLVSEPFEEACTYCKVKYIAALAFDIMLVLVLAAVVYRLLKSPTNAK